MFARAADRKKNANVLYADGTKALNGGLVAKAIELFGCYMMANKDFLMCYRAIGITNAMPGNGPKAVRSSRILLNGFTSKNKCRLS